jgi:hypothetical protein
MALLAPIASRCRLNLRRLDLIGSHPLNESLAGVFGWRCESAFCRASNRCSKLLGYQDRKVLRSSLGHIINLSISPPQHTSIAAI